MHTHRMRTGGDCSLLGQAAVPLAAPSALERLEQTHAVFSRIKGSLEPFVAKMLTAANAAALPSCAARKVARDTLSRHSLVFSNVPGPAEPLAICGQRVLGLHACYPNMIPQVVCA